MYLSILLGVVCNRDVAKQYNYTPDDFINKPKEDFKDFTTKNIFRIIDETYAYISCEGDCPFTTHNITLCFKFKNKIDVCLLNRNVDDEHNFFNIEKFVLIITASYTNWAMNLKHSNDTNYFNFSERRDLLNGNIRQQDLNRIIAALNAPQALNQPID
ncbi:14956_t:CDS:2 [Dentiscutata heterogama]|uniref:14956_t:CDS:1 n=1 Tax=Dentiscutata heterogama TaxID=1316150 RepID=A0ACA9KHX0_9GLOM|nr:14956_t:CDS:2 [Dentiscutata heterogama]